MRTSNALSNKEHLPALDGFRGLAVLLVFVSHILFEVFSDVPFLNALLFNSGYFGVSLFFVLSGFLVSSPFVKHILLQAPEVSIKKFYTNRLLRVLPLFYITSAVFFLIHIRSEANTTPYFNAIPYYALVIQNLFATVNIVNPPTWSVSVELHFYIFLGILFFVVKTWTEKKLWLSLFIILLATLAYKVVAYCLILKGGNYRDLIYANSLGNLDQFIIGILSGVLFYRKKEAVSPSLLKFFPLIGLAILLPLALYLFQQYQDKNYSTDFVAVVPSSIFLALGWSLLLLNSIRTNSITARIGAFPLLRFYGRISYSLYLLHLPIYTLYYKPYWKGHISSNMMLAALGYFALITLLSFLSYTFLEKPFLRLKNKNYSKTTKA